MWMTLKFAGTCKVCNTLLDKGSRAFYDRATKQLTCWDMKCCEADNLTEQQWVGSPVSGKWVPVRSERRIGPAYTTA